MAGQPSPSAEALREIKRERPQQPVVMVTAVAEVATAVESMRLGAHDHVLKPFALHDMLRKVADAINAGLTAESGQLRLLAGGDVLTGGPAGGDIA